MTMMDDINKARMHELIEGKIVPVAADQYGSITDMVVAYLMIEGLTASGTTGKGFTVWARGVVSL